MGYNIFVHLATAEKSVRPKVWGRSPLQRRAGNQGAKRKRVGENSAMSERNQKVDSPAVLLEEAGRHRKILFSLGEKEIRRAPCLPAGKIKRAKSIFLWYGEQGAQWRGRLP